MTAHGAAGIGWLRPVSIPRDALRVAALSIALVVAAVVLSRFSVVAFVGLGATLLVLLGYATYRWPRALLLFVVLAPVIDRYVIGLLLPEELRLWTRLFSESLLVVVGLVIGVVAVRSGRLVTALRHPLTIGLLAFVAASVVSVIVNGVPLYVAAAGLAFTLDALILFYLARSAGYDRRQLEIAALVFIGLMVVASLVAVAQALLAPNILGLPIVRGRFGEAVRVASFMSDPGLFGTMLCMAIGFPLFAYSRLDDQRLRRLAAATTFLFMLALLLSFSRGSWLGLIVGFGIVALLLDRRALVVAVVIGVLAFATAWFMPRNLLIRPGSGDLEAATAPDILGSTFDRAGAIGAGRDLRALFVTNALPIIRDHPVLGVGPGRYGGAAARTFDSPVYAEYGTDRLFWNPRQQTVDNFWLHLLVESGIAGTLAYVGMLAACALPLFRAAWRARGRDFILMASILSMTGAIAVSGVTGMLLEGNTASFALWLFLGAGSLVAATLNARRAEPAPSIRTGEQPSAAS